MNINETYIRIEENSITTFLCECPLTLTYSGQHLKIQANYAIHTNSVSSKCMNWEIRDSHPSKNEKKIGFTTTKLFIFSFIPVGIQKLSLHSKDLLRSANLFLHHQHSLDSEELCCNAPGYNRKHLHLRYCTCMDMLHVCVSVLISCTQHFFLHLFQLHFQLFNFHDIKLKKQSNILWLNSELLSLSLSELLLTDYAV